MTQIEPKPQRGAVSSAIQNAGEALHWLGRRLGPTGGGGTTPRTLDIWRAGGRRSNGAMPRAIGGASDGLLREPLADVEPENAPDLDEGRSQPPLEHVHPLAAAAVR